MAALATMAIDSRFLRFYVFFGLKVCDILAEKFLRKKGCGDATDQSLKWQQLC